jgi:hypothetical protein
MPRHRARSELIADREEQPRFRARKHMASFGVYCALTAETKRELGIALLGAQEEANRYTYWKDGVRFVMPPDMGITFVARYAIGRTIRDGAIDRGFSKERFMTHARQEDLLSRRNFSLPLGDLAWAGTEDRKVVATLADSKAHRTLLRQASTVVGVLQEVGGQFAEEDLHDPSHVALMMYGERRDFSNQARRRNNRLTENQQDDLAEIVQTHLRRAAISSVTVEGITVGGSYTGCLEDRLFPPTSTGPEAVMA